MADIDKLGRYDIIRVLGKGAMGVVYEGRDPNLDRPVAIKTIRVQNLSQQAAVEYEGRFRTEARSAARLHHPNIVSVFDSGQDGDTAYLVMEFIQGDDLKHHLECGARFSVRSAIVMVHELLMALDHAHRQNVVHRDIKPANMLMEVSGRVKLTDFGVARIQEPDETHLTQVGGAVGTPKYMSPEQAKGLRGDSRSDVFSAGVVLYELLTGKLPFDGENQFVVIHQIVSLEAAAPSSLNPQVPASMDEIMNRALAKNPDERYATAREFALALRAVAQTLALAPDGAAPDVAGDIAQTEGKPELDALTSAALRDGSSTGIFGPNADVSLVSTVNHEAELGAWSAIQDSVNPQDFQGFLAQFPAGIYARRAQQRLERLADGESAVPGTDSAHEMDAIASDLASTVGHFEPTLPLVMPLHQPPEQAVLPAQASMPVVPASSVAGVGRWLWLALAVVGSGLLVWQFFFRSAEPVQTLPPPPPVVVAPVVTAEVPVVHASEPVLVVSVAPAPLVESSAPAVVTPSKPVRPKAQASAPVASAPIAPRASQPAPALHGLGHGPSMPGQACADRVFIFRIACVAEQCNTDRYRQTPECVRFKEMERAREEERASRR